MKRAVMPAGEMTTLPLDVLTCFGCDEVYRIGRSALIGITRNGNVLRCCKCQRPLWITRLPRGAELN